MFYKVNCILFNLRFRILNVVIEEIKTTKYID